MEYSIDEHELTCSKCSSVLSLVQIKGLLYDHCKCYNIRLIYCKDNIHLTLLQERKDYWLDYKKEK